MSQDLERDIYITVLAHTIRLGKRPRPGQVLGGNFSLDQFDPETGVLTPGKKYPVEFEVTQELLDAAAAAINEQEVIYREPKTSARSLNGKPIPACAWDIGKKVQKP
jgi:hypothetical protein